MSIILTGILLIVSLIITVLFCIIAILVWNAYIRYLSLQVSSRPVVGPTTLQSYSFSTFMLKKSVEKAKNETCEDCCCVCLTGFEDGEDIRQLVYCKHSFHGDCIDMWLYSHSDCPLCRSPVSRINSDTSKLASMDDYQVTVCAV